MLIIFLSLEEPSIISDFTSLKKFKLLILLIDLVFKISLYGSPSSIRLISNYSFNSYVISKNINFFYKIFSVSEIINFKFNISPIKFSSTFDLIVSYCSLRTIRSISSSMSLILLSE